MSNHLAIATTTEAIAQIIRDAVTPLVPGADVTTDRPDRAGKDAAARVNVYLYQVAPNGALRNADLPLRGAGGRLENRPRTALDLYYLINFYGRDEQLVAQQLLGITAAALHLHARLSRADIERAVRAAPGGFLNDSTLADQTEPINVSPYGLTLEEMSKLWSMFQVPYALSMPYQCSVVVIDGPPAAGALPVRGVAAAVGPGGAPVVKSVESARAGSPIVAGGRVVIRGSGLTGAGPATVVIGDVVLTPAAGDATATQVTVALADPRLEAGPASLVVRSGGARSAPAAFVLAPAITAVRVRRGSAERPAALRITLDPPVWSYTGVTVLLNATDGGAPPPASYAFDLPLPPASDPPRRLSAITVSIPGVVPGTYLVRVRVNGVESPLDTGAGPGGTTPYVAPRVRVP